MARIEKLIIVGAGLIGGSFSLALKKAGAVGEVVGVGRRPETLQRAQQLGVIDAAGGYDRATFSGASLVLIATPVGQMQPVMRAMAPLLDKTTVVTDGGSTKQDVVKLARAELAAHLPRVVPGHPIAGTEHSGPEAAFPELYRGRRTVLTPLPESLPESVALVRAAWETCGARVTELPAADHDAALAAVSHLPHLLAFALVDELGLRPNGEQMFSFSGGGFRDFTRIASSHPEMWRDIALANQAALSSELRRYRDKLAVLQGLLDAGDGTAMQDMFERARVARARWLPSLQPPVQPAGK
ncbi:MAG TPA: prephenate dehydrogenase/arogenate dehydrogenase family protein [Burkholderiales bacterium]|nr:prephenate dehydrogenase/arogenate dehydrogenase family protein [Burkholderiales bacterium]